MTAVHDAESAQELAPDDVVGNALCDALLDAPDPSVIRVLNAHGGWCEASPSVQDYLRTLERVPDLAARWPAPDEHGTAILVYHEDGIRRRRETDSPSVDSAVVSVTEVERIVDARGQPELVPRDAVVQDGDADA